MGKHARVEPGGYLTIDTSAWLAQRTGGPDDELTADLHTWIAIHTDTGEPVTDPTRPPPGRDWPLAARTWCAHHGHELPEPDLIVHVETRLDAEVWVLRAVTAERYRIAVVGINHDPPAVYAESCTDPGEWFDADSVDISCPAGHGWTWRTGRELVTADGCRTTLTAVFGPNLDAPFSPCPACTAHHLGQRQQPCPCGGTPWIVCPTCQRRCDVELPTH
jgi:hypothetical protein